MLPLNIIYQYFRSQKHCAVLLSLLFILITASTISSAEVIATNAEDIAPILIGQELPSLVLKDANDKNFDLNKAVAQKPTLLIFYRGGWCPYCNTHLSELRKIEASLLAMGFQIIAISPDRPKFLQESMESNKLGYQLLSDSNMATSKALGLAYTVDSETLKKFDHYGIDIEKNAGQNHRLLPVPAALLVNTKGKVTFTFVAPNYKTRISNGLIMAAAEAQLE
ncbi:Peroxiredoxin [Alteromonadaceae bacterium Bs31]|nr:Peroxiredoxin [Alteromonadaceae bacterium Bs31]